MLENHLSQRRLSGTSSAMEKEISKQIENYIISYQKKNQGGEKESLSIYNKKELEKYRELEEYETQIMYYKYSYYLRKRSKDLERKRLLLA